jgi:hypothetical protein
MFLELESEMFIFNRNDPDLNQTINDFFVLKGTNVWAAPKPPSVPNLPLLLFATGILVAVVAVAVVVYLKKHKTSG